jgi:CheY-like chemotaxis protein
LGEGSCFRVSLMLPWVAQQDLAQKSISKIVGYEGYQRSLLLVDDDPVVRGLFCELLAPLGFRILEAQSGDKCLQMLEQTDVDFILLDINMPGINGLEVAAKLRQRNVNTPIVMLSADVQEQHGAIGATFSYDGYLIKPVANSVLLETIASHLALNWIYQNLEQPTHANEANSALPPSNISLQIPDHALLLELKACAQMGYHKGASELLEQIADQAILAPDTLSQLQLLCGNFQFEQLTKTLETNIYE